MPQESITPVLAVLGTLAVIGVVLPNVLAVLGLLKLRNGFSGGPEDANGYWPSRIDDDLYQEMLALGFQPVGTFWEQGPFTRRFEEFVFTRPGAKCFGILYPNNQIMPRRGSFITVFETGGVVFTKNYRGGVEVRQDDFLATGAGTEPAPELPPSPAEPQAPARSPWKPLAFFLTAGLLYIEAELNGPGRWPGSDRRVLIGVLGGLAVLGTLTLVATLLKIRPQVAAPRRPERDAVDLNLRNPLGEILAKHRLDVDRLIARGQQLPLHFDCDEFIATQQRYHRHPILRRTFQTAMGWLLVSKVIVLAPLPALCFCYRGVGDPLPWAILLAEGLVGLYLRYGCTSAEVVRFLRNLVRYDSGHRESGD